MSKKYKEKKKKMIVGRMIWKILIVPLIFAQSFATTQACAAHRSHFDGLITTYFLNNTTCPCVWPSYTLLLCLPVPAPSLPKPNPVPFHVDWSLLDSFLPPTPVYTVLKMIIWVETQYLGNVLENHVAKTLPLRHNVQPWSNQQLKCNNNRCWQWQPL